MRFFFTLLFVAGLGAAATDARAQAQTTPQPNLPTYQGMGGPEEPLALDTIQIEARRNDALRSIAPDPRLARRYERTAPARIAPLRFSF